MPHWFEPVAEHLGEAYLRYSFTKGTEQEVAFLVAQLGLAPGQRILDVGCGPGRHAHALARRGFEVVGVDISERFVALAAANAPPGASFVRGDARALRYDAEFDVVLSLCQGGLGLPDPPTALDPDVGVLERMAAAARPGGLVVFSAFAAYFQLRHLEASDTFDAAAGVNHERTEVRSPSGEAKGVDLWTSVFTPRELRLMCRLAGLQVRDVWSVTPGAYAPNPPGLDHPELLAVAERPRW
ncbi:MAG: class I SAM-dependent methyltransferase [Acidimicrobiales bacterium]